MPSSHYAVRIGREVGIFLNWSDCHASVNGFPGAVYKGFNSETEALKWMGPEARQIYLARLHKQAQQTPQT